MNVTDIVIIVVLLIGFFSGIGRGFVRGILGLVALVVGIMIASGNYQRLSGVAFTFVPGENGPEILSFILIFLVVVLLVGLAGRLISRALRHASLGWLDRLAGAILGIVVASVILSVILLLAAMAGLEEQKLLAESRMAPRVIGVTDVVVSILPEDARARIEEHYSKLRAQWDAVRQERARLVEETALLSESPVRPPLEAA
jgi:membrane protein required for colicin V production